MNKIILFSLLIIFCFGIGCEKKAETIAIDYERVLYNEQADPEAQISEALQKAGDSKRVLLMFGGNWCPWCHRLHHLFETDETVKSYLSDHYELVLLNVHRDKEKRNYTLNERYSNPWQFGFPVLVVLDNQGNLVTIQETGSLEKPEDSDVKGHDSEKVMAFLKTWAL